MKPPTFKDDDLWYALENAAEFLENEEWPEPDDKVRQEAANKYAANLIRRMLARRIKAKAKTKPHR
jgi:hypothetical protein